MKQNSMFTENISATGVNILYEFDCGNNLDARQKWDQVWKDN